MGSMLENIPSFVHPMDFSKHSVNPTKSAGQYCDYPRHVKNASRQCKRQKAHDNNPEKGMDGDGREKQEKG